MNKRKLEITVGGGDSGAETEEEGAKRAKSDNEEDDDGGNGGAISHSNVNSNVSSTSPPHQQASCPGFTWFRPHVVQGDHCGQRLQFVD